MFQVVTSSGLAGRTPGVGLVGNLSDEMKYVCLYGGIVQIHIGRHDALQKKIRLHFQAEVRAPCKQSVGGTEGLKIVCMGLTNRRARYLLL